MRVVVLTKKVSLFIVPLTSRSIDEQQDKTYRLVSQYISAGGKKWRGFELRNVVS